MTDSVFTSFIADKTSHKEIVCVWPNSEKDNPTISVGCTVNGGTVHDSKSSVCFPMAEITAIKLLDVKMLFLEVTASGDNFTKCFGSGGEYPCLSPFISQTC